MDTMTGMRKKLSAVLLATVLLLSLLPLSALAAQSGGYTYEVSNGKATITAYTGSGGAVTIPSKLGGYPVTAIGRHAFSNCLNLTSVSIPASVSNIGDFAFESCYSLTTIQVNASNANYASLGGVLFNKAKTKLIQCPNGNARTSYTIPGSVTSIEMWAFDHCGNLTSVTIPSSVKSIGNGAFSFTNLKSATIPASVTSIGVYVFASCFALSAIQVNTSNVKYASQDGVLFDKAKTKLIQYPPGSVRTSYTIPGSVTGIEPAAFADSSSLTSVTIPAGVAKIWDGTFANCEKLAAYSVSASNTKYSSRDGVLFNKAKTELIAYPAGSARTSYAIPGSVTYIEACAFVRSRNLKSVKIPSGATTIRWEAFANCSSLTDITLPNGLTTIEYGLFTGCGSLSSITIPSTVTSIDDYAFWSSGLKSVAIPGNLTSIGINAFGGTLLTSVTIPASVTDIRSEAFTYCWELEKVYFLGNAPTIGDAVFYDSKSTFTVVYVKGKTGFTNPWHGYRMAAVTPPAAPASVKAASAGYYSVKITWGVVSGASGYEVYRATSSTGTYSKVATVTGGSTVAYTNTGLTTGKAYYYKVKAYRTMGSAKLYSGYSAAASAKPVPATPAGVKAARASATSIKVSWNAVAGATGYEVYRATTSDGAYTLMKAVTTLNWTNTGLTTGRTYYYKVRAYKVVGSAKVYGGYSAVVSAKP